MPAPSTCTVSGVLYGPTAQPVENAKIKVFVTSAFTDASGNYIPAGLMASTSSDADGLWSLDVIRTEGLAHSVTFQFEYPLGNNQSANVKYPAVIPDAATADFADLVDLSTGTAALASAPTTDALPEGSVNLYFTTARAAAAAPVTSVAGRTGAVTLTKTDVGLSSVDNTADLDKPVSSAQDAADDAVQAFAIQRANHTGTQLASTISDFNAAAAAAAPVTSVAGQTGAVTLAKGDVGLGNVDNTSDATKNSATATLTNKTLTAPVINSPTGIVKGDVGLGNVDNTSDAAKPVSTATQTALDLKVDASATIAINRGGTGQVTAQAAIDALLPSQTSNSGKFLTTNGTTSSWDTVSGGATVNNWGDEAVTITPSASFGTTSNQVTKARRVGDTVEVMCKFTAGTLTASAAYIDIGASWTIDTAKIIGGTDMAILGYCHSISSGGAFNIFTSTGWTSGLIYDGSTATRLYFGYNSGSNAISHNNANDLAVNNSIITLRFSYPVSGWSA